MVACTFRPDELKVWQKKVPVREGNSTLRKVGAEFFCVSNKFRAGEKGLILKNSMVGIRCVCFFF